MLPLATYPTARDVLHDLLSVGCRMRLEAGQLQVDDPAQMLTEARRQGIRQHHTALVTLVERLEEKSALLEYDEGYLRNEAERVAWALLCHTAIPTPYQPPLQRWYERLRYILPHRL